jgi:pyruvate dehydrogenase E1 component
MGSRRHHSRRHPPDVPRSEDVHYYVTLMNENYAHLAPAGARRASSRGYTCCRRKGRAGARVQLMGSAIQREVIAAADLLRDDWKVDADIWSATSQRAASRGMGVEREPAASGQARRKS